MKEYASMKLTKRTHTLLRLIAAHTDANMMDVADRLVAQEWERVKEMVSEQVTGQRVPAYRVAIAGDSDRVE